MECIAVALDQGRRVVPRRPLTYTSSIDVFLALYERHRVSLPWSVWRVDGECNLTDELVNGFLERQSHLLLETHGEFSSLLQTFDGLGGGLRVAECNKTCGA